MPKTVFTIKGVFPGNYDTNVHVFEKGTMEFKAVHWHERCSQGQIWIDGVKINPKRASQLRRRFSSRKTHFTWGHDGAATKITALAICLHLFETEQTAVNLYLPFMREIMKDIEMKSFEMSFEITEFYLDNFHRTSLDFHTLYCDLGLQGKHEINFTKDQQSGEYYCDIRDQICTDLVVQEKKEYHKPSLANAFFGGQDPPKPEFDWQAAYMKHMKEVTDLYFDSGQIRTRTKSTMISKIKFSMKWYGINREEHFYKKNKGKVEAIRRRLARLRAGDSSFD